MKVTDELSGVLNVLKPPGMTSHDVVAVLRRWLGLRKIGHTGTLDPGAAGVLPICLGRATRLAEYLSGLGKCYRAEVIFGIATDTQDSFGTPTDTAGAGHLQSAHILAVLPQLTGPQEQIPPMVSAVRVGGQRLYQLARRGQQVERPSRRVIIDRLELLSFRSGFRAVARLDIACSKGTYIRTLAADLGRAVGVPAHLNHLVRTVAGHFELSKAVTLEELLLHGPGPYIISMARAVAFLPSLTLAAAEAEGVCHGRPPQRKGSLAAATAIGGVVALLDEAGRLLALARRQGDGLCLEKVLN